MSSESTPITPARFRLAIQDLGIENLHGKAAELRNSILHLERSNKELEEWTSDTDCADALQENQEVIKKFEERIQMLKEEVEGRGMPWVEEEKREVKLNGEAMENGVGDVEMEDTGREAPTEESREASAASVQQTAPAAEEEDGLHL